MAKVAATQHVASSVGFRVVLPLALAQFIASFAATNMNVAISSIARDLGTTVSGIQTAITLFTLIMAAFMIPGSKLTDIWGRKFCLLLGLVIYGSGALLSALAQSLGLLIIGYSLFEGIGSALMIPPIYIFITVLFSDPSARAKNFGLISAAAGIGAAAGPLIGGMVTSAISWRASFILQALVVATIIFLARKVVDTRKITNPPAFDVLGMALSAAGLVFVVMGFLLAGTYGWIIAKTAFVIGNTTLLQQGSLSPVVFAVALGALLLWWFVAHVRTREEHGKPPLVSLRVFGSKLANLGLITQNTQWLGMQGTFFVVSVFLQTVRNYSAIMTGLILTPATIGILGSSILAGRLAKRFTQVNLIRWGFVITIVGVVLLLLLARAESSIWTFVPGLLTMGAGIGVMLTSSVNVVQSSFAEADQGEISGVSRSVSNLGSSLGVAIAGTTLVSSLVTDNWHFVLALLVLLAASAVGLISALAMPTSPRPVQRAVMSPAA